VENETGSYSEVRCRFAGGYPRKFVTVTLGPLSEEVVNLDEYGLANDRRGYIECSSELDGEYKDPRDFTCSLEGTCMGTGFRDAVSATACPRVGELGDMYH
jgi:hypothetical protein